MSNEHCEIDIDKVIAMFDEFNKRERKQVFRNAIRKALSIVRNESIKNLKKYPKKSGGSIDINKVDKWGHSLRKGIKTAVYRNNKQGVIHLMENFKNRFFELGMYKTGDRYNVNRWSEKTGKTKLKKKRYTGQVKGIKYFGDAVKSKEGEVFGSIRKILEDNIKKINAKHSK